MAEVVAWLVRRRVTLGFVAAAAALALAQPTWAAWRVGLVVALAGECLRVWAAGHLEKSREVTQSGPYRWTRHPLYVGSAVMAVGIAIASRSPLVALLTAAYIGTTIPAAMRAEEGYLERTFGPAYAAYRRSAVGGSERRFSWERAKRNREYRAVAGLAAGFALLAMKIVLPI